jgi:hypothetical protein
MVTFYGSDTACTTDLPLVSTLVTDPRQLIGQRTIRRLTTPRGALALINDDPNFGFDVRQYVNAILTPAQISTAQSNIQDEVTKDEQVQSADVAFTLGAAGAIFIQIAMQTLAGPFSMTLTVNDLTAQSVFDFTS